MCLDPGVDYFQLLLGILVDTDAESEEGKNFGNDGGGSYL